MCVSFGAAAKRLREAERKGKASFVVEAYAILKECAPGKLSAKDAGFGAGPLRAVKSADGVLLEGDACKEELRATRRRATPR